MKWISLLVIFLFYSVNVFAALPASGTSYLNWAVDTAGDDTNGGCYHEKGGGVGTDYTDTETAAQLSLTDLATSGVGVTTLTSATGGFTSAMVDNCIQIASGTNVTAGFYEITAYTDTNTVTLDRAPDNGVGGISSGNGKVGGALATIQKTADNVVAYSHVFIKSGTYAEEVTTSAVDWVKWIGFQTTRHDEPTGTNRPLIDCNTIGDDCWHNVGGCDNNYLMNIQLTNATDDGIYTQSTNLTLYNVRSYNNGNDGLTGDGLKAIWYSEFDGNGNDGVETNGYSKNYFYYNYGHDNTGRGLFHNKYNYICDYFGNLAESNSGDGLGGCIANYVVGNTAYNNTGVGSDGIIFSRGNDATDDNSFFINNLSSDNGGYGIVVTTSDDVKIAVAGNAAYNNTSGNFSNLDGADFYSMNITTDTKVTTDGELLSGSSAIGAGFGIEDVTTLTVDTSMNIGVDQDDNASGGGSVTVGYGYTQ